MQYNTKLGLSDQEIASIGTYTANKTINEEEIANQTGTGFNENQVFSVNANPITEWRVLGINKFGEVELMGITPNTVHFSGQAGYINGPKILNNISKIYGYGKGATGARSMTIENVDQYTDYNKTMYENERI